MSALRQRLDALNPQQRALLAKKLGRHQAASQRGLPRAPRTGASFPLSFAQEQAWRRASTHPSGDLHRGLWFRAALNPEALRQALEGVIARHEAWRSTFHAVNGQLEQRPGPAPRLALPRHPLPATLDAHAQLTKVCHELRAAPFSLEQGPLYRFALTETERPEIYTFVAVFHPIIFDGASAGLFLAELSRSYLTLRGSARAVGPARAEMPPLALQLVDHAVWERQQGEARWAEPLRVRRAQLTGAPVSELPPPAPPRRHALRLAPALVEALRERSAQAGVPLQATLLAAFLALLARHGVQEELVVALPVANRGADPELRNLLGCFENTALLRAPGPAASGFDALQQLSARLDEALAHAELPLQRLLDGLPSSALPQVGFTFQEAISLPEDLGLPVEALGRLEPEADAALPLQLTLREEAGTGALRGGLEVCVELPVEAMAQALVALLEGLVASPPVDPRGG
ncbi:MAG: hypothetical protein H6741_12195 [Alphaproteobacteria bacterium]|nr:hypothetical protein [Alphaproteobacteria bacterium]